MLTDLEKKTILVLQRDLDVTPRPFLELAQHLEVTEAELLDAIRSLLAKGFIRRFGATLRHQLSGFDANAMVVWQVPEEAVNAIGEKLARYREVTHCYAREPAPDWPYNLYTMIHARTAEEVKQLAARMALEVGLSAYQILFSDAELKKTTMRYFHPEP